MIWLHKLVVGDSNDLIYIAGTSPNPVKAKFVGPIISLSDTTPSKRLSQDPTMNAVFLLHYRRFREKAQTFRVKEKAKISPHFYFIRLWSASGSGLCFVVL